MSDAALPAPPESPESPELSAGSADPAAAAPASSPRLYPRRFTGRYYVLTQLRKQMEAMIAACVTDQPGTLVDFGCGDAPYQPLFPSHVQYLTADLPSNPGARLHIGADGRVNLPGTAADYVLSSQVLEHVPDPATYLAECHRLLKPAGAMMLTTHGVWKYHPHPTDLWRWTGEGLRRIVEAAGFEIERFTGVLGLGATGMLLLQDALVTRSPRKLRPLIAGAMQPLIRAADALHDDGQRSRDAAVFCLIARKPQAAEAET